MQQDIRDEFKEYQKNGNELSSNYTRTIIALRNKVKIMAKGNNPLALKHDFIIFSNMDFKFPKIEIPNFDSIVIPNMNFDFNFDTENILKDFDDLDKNMGKTRKHSFE